MFLWGPASQCKSWFHKDRRGTSIVFFSSIALVIVAVCLNGIAMDNGFDKMWAVILLLVLVQYCAYFWLCLSYIPFGRKLFCKCCKKTIGDE